ncbi:MAG: hypothetical protein FWE37_05640 [Spirochaetaceae bacterium]|nr:hypothetical protein [Spirochaetaceae bacterium]
MHKLDTALVEEAMQRGEFNRLITNSQPTVAIVLSQSWCPEWHNMHAYLSKMPSDNIYYFLYDESEIFNDFQKFKETTFANSVIPYVRFYKNGNFVGDSNYLSVGEFKERLK